MSEGSDDDVPGGTKEERDALGGGQPPGGGMLPPKPDIAMALIQTAPSVFVHLDPRGDDVMVPAWFKKQPQLVLQIGLNMAVPIPDLDIGDDALSCTLSFNKRPEFCRIPWDAIYGLVGDDGRGMIWPESVPPEVAAAAEGRAPAKKEPRRPRLRLASSDGESQEAEADEAAEAAPLAEKTTPEAGTDDAAGDSEGHGEASDEAEDPMPSDGQGSEPDPAAEATPAPEGEPAPAEPPEQGARKLPPYLRVVK